MNVQMSGSLVRCVPEGDHQSQRSCAHRSAIGAGVGCGMLVELPVLFDDEDNVLDLGDYIEFQPNTFARKVTTASKRTMIYQVQESNVRRSRSAPRCGSGSR